MGDMAAASPEEAWVDGAPWVLGARGWHCCVHLSAPLAPDVLAEGSWWAKPCGAREGGRARAGPQAAGTDSL